MVDFSRIFYLPFILWGNMHAGLKIVLEAVTNEKVIPKWGTEALESQLISTDESLWETKNYRHFLEFRREAIVKYLNEFMKRLDSHS